MKQPSALHFVYDAGVRVDECSSCCVWMKTCEMFAQVRVEAGGGSERLETDRKQPEQTPSWEGTDRTS